jgi:hypothetical protein
MGIMIVSKQLLRRQTTARGAKVTSMYPVYQDALVVR